MGTKMTIGEEINKVFNDYFSMSKAEVDKIDKKREETKEKGKGRK